MAGFMTEEKKSRDQRKHTRYELELGVAGVFCSDSNISPGHVIDISLGGLSFFYYDGEEWSDETEEFVNIFGEGLNIENIPLLTVSDFTVIEKNHPIYEKVTRLPFGSGKVRRRGIKFGSLTSEQRAKLEEFIRRSSTSRERGEKE